MASASAGLDPAMLKDQKERLLAFFTAAKGEVTSLQSFPGLP